MAHPVLRIGVMELRRRPGTQRDVRISTSIPGLAITSARVPDDAELVLDATLESVEGGAITLTGSVQVPWTAECRRCLDEVGGVLDVEVREVFEQHPTDDTFPIEGDEVDLEPVVRDAALLNLPLAPLCGPDCRGPAPEALPIVVEGETPAEPTVDPRWAALDELRLDPD
jgi:uncharacterized protein